MHLLPTNLGRLAEHTERATGGRFALSHVRLRVHGDNTFMAEATDTKVLLRVWGPCQAPPEEFPEVNVPGLTAAPNGQTESLVPGDVWKKTFAAAKKLTGKSRVDCVRAVATKIGAKVTTFAASDMASHQCESVQNGEGRFPPTDAILSGKRGGDVRVAFAVDPIMLADLLKSCADIACDEEDMRVEFEVRQPGHPITIRARRSDGLQAHAVIMPLADEKKPTAATDDEGEEENPRIIELEKKLGLMTAERDAQREVADSKTEELVSARARNSEYQATITELTHQLGTREIRDIESGNATVPVPSPARCLTMATRPLSRRERLLAMSGDN